MHSKFLGMLTGANYEEEISTHQGMNKIDNIL